MTNETLNETKSDKISSKQRNIEILFLAIIFPLCQMMELFLSANGIMGLFSLSLPVYFTFLTILSLLFIVIVFFAYNYLSKRSAQKRYQELSSLQSYQKKHYANIQIQRERMNDLKADYQSNLATVHCFLECNRNEKALELLEALMTRVNATKEYPFCPSPIINAVLSDKEHICKQSSIPFQADLNIGSCEAIPPVYLCNIFSNLLDNAVSACQDINDISKRFIQVTAKQSGDYLHIKVKNSSNTPTASIDGHGYGQKIVKDIAEKYNGSFQTFYENGTYEAYLSIQFPIER